MYSSVTVFNYSKLPLEIRLLFPKILLENSKQQNACPEIFFVAN